MIAIMDYGIGNLGSVKNALDHLGISNVITSDKAIAGTFFEDGALSGPLCEG